MDPSVTAPPQAHTVVVRSLRRRLWRAFQDEDIDTAIRAYTATRKDYDEWLAQEAAEAEQKRLEVYEARQKEKKENRDARPAALKKFGVLVRSARGSFKGEQQGEGRRSSKQQHKGAFPVVSLKPTADSDEFWGTHPPSSTHSSANSVGVGVLELEMDPSEPFQDDDFESPHDPILAEADAGEKQLPLRRRRLRHQQNVVPRLAGFFGKFGNQHDTKSSELDKKNSFEDGASSEGEDRDAIDERLTTPLHEAARLGSGQLVRLMLGHGGEPNRRNGQLRTVLHMAAGGLTEEEERLVVAAHATRDGEILTSESAEAVEVVGPGVGIRSPHVEAEESENGSEEHPAAAGAKKAARAMSRFFKQTLGNRDDIEKKEYNIGTGGGPEEVIPPLDMDRLNRRTTDRMDAVLALLSWCHPEDDTPAAGEGPSINSVDARGRTALHYAAELGRTDVCMAMLSSFGTILTVVDESGETPGELAAERTHIALAAQLEARALLYTDPYGMDDELMASVLADAQFIESENKTEDADVLGDQVRSSCRKALVPPFSWFETWTMEKVHIEREQRIDDALMKMNDVLKKRQVDREMNELMFGHAGGVDDSLDSTVTDIPARVTEETEGSIKKAEESFAPKELDEVVLADGGNMGPQEKSVTEDSADHRDVRMPEPASESIQDDAACSAAVVDSGTTEDAVDSIVDDNKIVQIDDDKQEETAGDGEQDGKSNKADVEANGFLELLDASHMDRFLTFHDWDVDRALEIFSVAPDKALAEAGVHVAVEDKDTGVRVETESVSEDAGSTVTCLICCEDLLPDSPEWKTLKGCGHSFCAECLGDYIAETARSMSSALSMACPHHNCSALMFQQEVEVLAPNSDTYRALAKAADENFIASSPDIRFCPSPGCEGVVRRLVPPFMQSASLDRSIIDFTGAVCTAVSGREPLDAPCTYEGVQDRSYLMVKNMSQPQKAHRFCFACGEDMHWPVTCETLEKWKEQIEEEIGTVEDEDGDGDTKFDDVAQQLWMKANTRPCPQCKAPIEKNEGCNHMICSNRHCRHEFCWICRKDWKMHTSKTGGFFRCNIWQTDENHEYYDTPPPPEQRTAAASASASNEPDPNDQGYGSAIHSSRSAWKKSRAMARFLHHYRRYIAHSESAALERSMADTVCSRLAPVVEAAVDFSGFEDFDFGGRGLSFVHAAFTELLECRSILQHSYAFAFYRYPVFYYYRYHRLMKIREKEKESFEELQAQLEMLTEQMSDVVARSHLRATQTQIMFLTSGAAEKRRELTTLMISVLDDERKEEMQDRDQGFGETENKMSPPEFLRSVHADHPTHGPPRGSSRFAYPGRGHGTRMQAGTEPPVVGRDEEALTSGQTEELSRAEDEAVRQAIRESMQPFMAETDEMPGSDVANNGDRWVDWSCATCTYMNAGGSACAMCGSARVF